VFFSLEFHIRRMGLCQVGLRNSVAGRSLVPICVIITIIFFCVSRWVCNCFVYLFLDLLFLRCTKQYKKDLRGMF
jgi:hypothetical protein